MNIGLLKNLYIFVIIQYGNNLVSGGLYYRFTAPSLQAFKDTGFTSFRHYLLQHAFTGGTT